MAEQNRNIDWGAIRLDYVTGRDGYRALAARYKVPMRRLEKIARAEGWVEQRAAWRKKTEEAVLQDATRQEVARVRQLRRSADKLADLIEEVTSDVKNFEYGGQFSVNRMQAVIAGLKDLTAVTRNLYELPTQSESASQQLARERLDIERERLAMEKAKASFGGDESETGVVMLPDVEEEIEPAAEAMQEAVGS